MPRPMKVRTVCDLPNTSMFVPMGAGSYCDVVMMSIDEYETIRLIDYEDLTQQECSEQMGVARTTVQAIYNNARKKLAECLVQGKRLYIVGGDYLLCSGTRRECPRNTGCPRRDIVE